MENHCKIISEMSFMTYSCKCSGMAQGLSANVSGLVSGLSGPSSSTGWEHCFVLLGTHAGVPTNLMLGVTLRRTSIPSREPVHATETRISSDLMGHLA